MTSFGIAVWQTVCHAPLNFPDVTNSNSFKRNLRFSQTNSFFFLNSSVLWNKFHFEWCQLGRFKFVSCIAKPRRDRLSFPVEILVPKWRRFDVASMLIWRHFTSCARWVWPYSDIRSPGSSVGKRWPANLTISRWVLLNRYRGSIAYSLSLSTSHRPMTEILLKRTLNRKSTIQPFRKLWKT